MLDEEIKAEMLADGLSAERRKQFHDCKVSSSSRPENRDIDTYIKFLMDMQKILPDCGVKKEDWPLAGRYLL